LPKQVTPKKLIKALEKLGFKEQEQRKATTVLNTPMEEKQQFQSMAKKKLLPRLI